MSGTISGTVSPGSVSSRRSTPCVAGWCGPMLIVKSSVVGSASVPTTGRVGPVPMRSSVTDFSRSRYGTESGSLLIPLGHLVLVEREDHRLAAHREVAPLRMALVVLWHQDPAEVGMAGEDDAEHVVDLALL